MNKLKLLNKYNAAVTFLALEFFALMAFNYGGSYLLFGALSLSLSVLLALFNIKDIKSQGLFNFLLLLIPLFIFAILTALGTYSRAHAFVGDFSTAELIFVPLGLLGMAFNGYILSLDKNFKLKTFLTVIFAALAVYVLINLIYNLIAFGAFYPIRLKGYYLYYNGIKSSLPVNDFAYTLEGFKFIEVEMNHYVLYPLLLLSSSVLLLYLSPKKERLTFIIYSVFTFIALISLIFVPSVLSLASIVVVAILDLIIYLSKRYLGCRKVFKVILIVFLVLFISGFVLIIVNNQSIFAGIHNVLAKVGLFNKILNTNGKIAPYNEVVTDIFSGSKFLGFVVQEIASGVFEEVHLSGGFIFDSFMTSGVIGALGLFVFIWAGFKSYKKYFKLHLDDFALQAASLLFLILFIGFSAFFNKGEYALYYKIYRPLYLTSPFMIMVFIFTYVFSKTANHVEPKKEELVNE